MNIGRSLQSLAAELERQRATRKDYLAPQEKLTAVVDGDVVKIDGLNGLPLPLTPYAHRQVADHLAIPQKYYERMAAEQPALLAENMNTWLRAGGTERRMVRTLDNRVRAFMSQKYRPLDNFELAEAVLPKLVDLNVEVTSCELTETRMYIKGILPGLSDDLPAGVVWGSGHTAVVEYRGNQAGKVVAAIVISNSEIGAGTLRIEPSVFTTWCTNLAIISQAAMRKYHIGRAFEAQEDFSIYRDETRDANDRAFWLKVGDVANAAFDRTIFQAAVAQIKSAAGSRIISENLPAVVDAVVEQLALPERTSSGILTGLARGGDLTKWGLSSAITALANTTADYETATSLERAGGKVLAMETRDWVRVASAVAA
jgi:hypothetical protein